jgi:coiled-coil domain-containing protein 77
MAGEEKTPPLLSMLQRLPPSKELLDFYHKKLEQYVDEEARWLKRLATTKKAVDQSSELQTEVFAKSREISALQKAITDMREALAQERKINNKLYADNDKIRV